MQECVAEVDEVIERLGNLSIERQLKDERDARKALEDEINKLKRKNDEICEFYKPKSQMS